MFADITVRGQLLAVKDFLATVALDPEIDRRVPLDESADAGFSLAEPFARQDAIREKPHVEPVYW